MNEGTWVPKSPLPKLIHITDAEAEAIKADNPQRVIQKVINILPSRPKEWQPINLQELGF